ncbi:MAG: class I mannose-6-phosphate isomerase, partial [Halobacteriovoraceae bacterium]|nr:class I mannose-6-phosphate isomerase [Halobacteriovoraceae bacterium]
MPGKDQSFQAPSIDCLHSLASPPKLRVTIRAVEKGDPLAQLPKITFLDPHIMQKIWGGQRLSKIGKGKQANIGETWEVSDHPDGPALFNGQALSQILPNPLSYLVKLIDTSDNLSVQVHPHEEYAKEHENSHGKTECWVILDADPGAGIYLGLKEGCNKASFEEALKTGCEMDKFLNFYPVSAGDFFFVAAGTIHAIGKGVFLAEVQ